MKKFAKSAAAVISALAIIATTPIAQAFAAQKKTTTSDNFDNASVIGSIDSEKWSKNSSSIKVEEVIPSTYALKMGSQGGNEVQAALVSKNQLKNLKEITFDIKYCSPSWFHIGFPKTKNDMMTANGEFNPYRRDLLQGCDIFKQNEWQSVKIEVLSEKTFNLYVADKGKEFPSEPIKADGYTLPDTDSFKDCYFEMEVQTSENMDKDPHVFVDNFKFISEDNSVVEDDFENQSMTNFEALGATVKNADGEKTYVADYSVVFVDGANKLAFDSSKKGDMLMLSKKIEKNDKFLKSSDAVLDVSFDVIFDESAADTDSLSYFFAMDSAAGTPFKNTWAYTITKNGGKAERFDADGNIEESEGNTNEFVGLTSEEGSTIKIKLTQNGTLYVYENGEEKLCMGGVDKYEGFTGLAVQTDNTSKIYVDNFVINEYSFEKVVTKSVSHNFSNGYFGPDGKEDFVYLADSGTIEARDGELVWERCADGTYFGSAYKYDNFVMEYKMTSIYGGWQPGMATDERTAANRWIGFDFGRKSAKSKTYGSYGMIATRITHPTINNDDSKKLVSNWKKCDTFLYKAAGTSEMQDEVFTIVKDIPSSYFKDITYDGESVKKTDISSDAAVCFKWVGEDNKLSLYMKRADEGEYTLYITVENIEISGYLAIMCTGYVYCTFDDFSVTNTATIYDLADTTVPDKGSGGTKTEVIYDRGNVDVNWNDELDLNKNNGGSSGDGRKGCGASVGAGSVGVTGAVIAAAVALKKKRKKDDE